MATSPAVDLFDFATARRVMVDSQVRTNDVTDHALQDALLSTPREALLPPELARLAYVERELEYAPGYRLMQPRDIGKLLQALHPRAGEQALCLAAPYAAAVLARMGLSVTSLDPAATPPAASFDVAVSEGAVAQAPPAWLAALTPGGRLAVVERDGPVGRARIYTRTEQGTGAVTAFDATPSWLPGFEPRASFTF